MPSLRSGPCYHALEAPHFERFDERIKAVSSMTVDSRSAATAASKRAGEPADRRAWRNEGGDRARDEREEPDRVADQLLHNGERVVRGRDVQLTCVPGRVRLVVDRVACAEHFQRGEHERHGRRVGGEAPPPRSLFRLHESREAYPISGLKVHRLSGN